MFVHTVYFWLKDTTSETNLETFRAGVETLRNIDTVRAMYVGRPADTDRPVIDRSYTFALTVVFDDQAGHDVYQTHAIHLDFVKDFGDRWDRVLIYDAV